MRSAPRAAFAARSLALLSLLSTTSVYASPSPDAQPADAAALESRASALTYQGCYSSDSGLTFASNYLYQSSSYCAQSICTGGQSVLGLSNGNGCYCGNSVPPSSDKVDDSLCNTPCAGFGVDMCGGSNTYSVYLTGVGKVVPNSDSSSSSSSSSEEASSTTSTSAPQSASQTTQTPVVVTSVAPGHTVVVTQSATSSATPSAEPKGSSNTVGIAVGVVVGLIALAAIGGGAFFFIRRKRQLAFMEEHRQRAQVSDFMAGGGVGGMKRSDTTNSYSHRSDLRLDPEAGRRNSFGSIMDDSQDYSRKILRVANPDSQ